MKKRAKNVSCCANALDLYLAIDENEKEF